VLPRHAAYLSEVIQLAERAKKRCMQLR